VLGLDPAANVADLALQNGLPTWVRFFNEATADEILGKQGVFVCQAIYRRRHNLHCLPMLAAEE
jgi:hypothetical protein